MMRLRFFTHSLVCVWAAFFFLVAVAVAAPKKKEEKNEFPNATRQEPKTSISESSQKQISSAFKSLDDQETDKAAAQLDKVLQDKRASAYARALALQAYSQIKWEKDDADGAIDMIRQAVQLNALPNKSHFQAMYQLAQLLLTQEKYQESLDAVNDWFKQSGSQTPDAYALQGNAYYRLEKYQEAINSIKKALSLAEKPNESWMQILMGSYFELDQFDEAAKLAEQQLAKDPSNKKLIQQLSSIYINAKQEQKAVDLMANAQSKGLITTEDDYKQLAQLYNYTGKSKEATTVLNEGLQKGIIKPSYEMYKLLGDAYELAEDSERAIEAYGKASPLAKDGNVDYLRGYLLFYNEHSQAAKEALTQAIAKGGLKQEGEAYLLLGNAEYDLGNNAAALVAYEKAKNFSSTQKMAESGIKNVKAGGPAPAKKKAKIN